jgi:hypothetical protein
VYSQGGFSSDFWVVPQINNSFRTTQSTSVDFLEGHAEGPICLAELEFAGYKVPQQAFSKAPTLNVYSSRISSMVSIVQINSSISQDLGANGLIGLSPDAVSNVFEVSGADVHDNVGDTPLASILKTNSSVPHILTFTLGRDNIASVDPPQGILTIGEIAPGMEAISAQPKLNIVSEVNSVVGHVPLPWAVLLDRDGVKVNGKTVTLPKSAIKNTTTPDQLLVIMDTGFSFPQVPKSVHSFPCWMRVK